jgi:hypothetical protein
MKAHEVPRVVERNPDGPCQGRHLGVRNIANDVTSRRKGGANEAVALGALPSRRLKIVLSRPS